MKRSTMLVLAALFVVLPSLMSLLGLYTDWLFLAKPALKRFSAPCCRPNWAERCCLAWPCC